MNGTHGLPAVKKSEVTDIWRTSVGKHVVLADRSKANAEAAAAVMSNAGYTVSVATVDVSSRGAVRTLVSTASGIGEILPSEQRH